MNRLSPNEEFTYNRYGHYPLVRYLREQVPEMPKLTRDIYLRETFSPYEQEIKSLVSEHTSSLKQQKKAYHRVWKQILTQTTLEEDVPRTAHEAIDNAIRQAARVESHTEIREALSHLVENTEGPSVSIRDIVNSSILHYNKRLLGLSFVSALGIMGAVTGHNNVHFQQAGAENTRLASTKEFRPEIEILPFELSMFEKEKLPLDVPLIYDDILSLAQTLKQRQLSENISREIYTQTITFLLGGLDPSDAQSTFVITTSKDGYVRTKLKQQEPSLEKHQTDILIVGGEIESITTAMHAVTAGYNVTLLYSGPLGGIASDKGANMRYFDHMNEAVTFKHKELFQQILRMEAKNSWAIPKGIDVRIERYLTRKYPSLRLIQTGSYRSLNLATRGKLISYVRTQEGLVIVPQHVIDSSPSGSIASKTPLPRSLDTPHLGYGVVFDISDVGQADFTHLYMDPARLSLDALMMLADVTEEEVHAAAHLQAKIQQYLGLSHVRDIAHAGPYVSFGFKKIGYAYDLYMHFLALRNSDMRLQQLNRDRIPDGLNIAFRGETATCNSLSYRSFQGSMRAQFQNEHNLHFDKEFASLREIEIPSLEVFLQKLFSKPSISVQLPQELYVRKAHISFQTQHSPQLSDFQYKGSGLSAKYPNDVRSMTPRYTGDTLQHSIAEIQAKMRELRWKIEPRHAMTEIPNLYMVSKSAFHPLYSGAMRIQQNLIGLGYMTVEEIRTSQTQTRSFQKQEGYHRPGAEMLEAYLHL